MKDFDPSQVQSHQLFGQGQSMYDDVLKANNSEIVIDENKMSEIVNEYFIKNAQ